MVEKKSPKPKRACFFIGDFRVMFEKIEATHIFGGYMQRERPQMMSDDLQTFLTRPPPPP